MNQAVYKLYMLNSGKDLNIFIYLANKSNSSSNLGSISKRIKLTNIIIYSWTNSWV